MVTSQGGGPCYTARCIGKEVTVNVSYVVGLVVLVILIILLLRLV